MIQNNWIWDARREILRKIVIGESPTVRLRDKLAPMHTRHYYTRIVAHVLRQYTRCGQCTCIHMCAQTRAITLIASGCRGDSEPRLQKRLIIFNETADYARGAFSLRARERGSWRHARLYVNNSAACRRDTYARLLNRFAAYIATSQSPGTDGSRSDSYIRRASIHSRISRTFCSAD